MVGPDDCFYIFTADVQAGDIGVEDVGNICSDVDVGRVLDQRYGFRGEIFPVVSHA